MATMLVKHREEERIFAIDFTEELDEIERVFGTRPTVDSVDAFAVLNEADEDKTTEILSGVAQAVDPQLRFLAKIAASGSVQLSGIYRIKGRVILSDTQKPIALGDGDRLILLKIVGND